MDRAPGPDFTFEYDGDLWYLTPHTPAAREYVAKQLTWEVQDEHGVVAILNTFAPATALYARGAGLVVDWIGEEDWKDDE